MDSRVLSDCAALLGRELEEIEALYADAELLPALLARIGLALGTLRSTTRMRGAQGPFYAAMDIGWGQKPFLAVELLAWCEQGATPMQRAAMTAARALCAVEAGAELSANRLGMELRALAEAPAVDGLHIEKIGAPRGSSRWVLRDLRE